MMTLANYAIGAGKQKDRNVDKNLNKSLQIRNRAEHTLKHLLKTHHKLTDEKSLEILALTKEYYSRLPLDSLIWNKYQTKQCIIDSVLLLDTGFNPYKAREAFKLVEKMLINLVYLPWHPEFREIHLYSGLFRMSISEPLIGAEEVFKAAGFVTSSNSVMHLYLPDDKMPQADDGESITSVIFDSILAQTVCSDMISVFESCCKAAKISSDGSQIYDSLSYSWLRAYIAERSQETTERVCCKLQDLFRDLTTNLTRVHNNKSHAQEDKNSGEEHLRPAISRGAKQIAHDRTREFLMQQSREDAGTLMLSQDLLRLPVSSSDLNSRTEIIEVDQQSVSRPKLNQRQTARDMPQQNLDSEENCSGAQYQKRPAYDRNLGRHPVSLEGPKGNFNLHDGAVVETIDTNHPHHNDREPLLPKYERRTISQYNPTSSRKVASGYDSYDGSALLPNGSTHSSRGLNRHQYNDTATSYYENTSQSQAAACNQTKGAASKYHNIQYTKYTERDQPEKLSSSRSHWSCSACTYSNQINSETCEMCHRRRC